MGIFFKSDGLKSYQLGSSRVYQRSFSTAYDFSTVSEVSNTSSLYGNDGSYTDSIFLSSAGTTLYILYTDYNGTTNQGYMKSYTLATAWDLSSLSNPTTPTTITFPLGTEFNVYSGNSALQKWSGLEFADDGLSFHFLRYERSTTSGTSNSVTFKGVYTLSTAWLLSSSSLTSTTKIDYATTTSSYSGQCLGFHEMSGGELVLSMGGNYVTLDSITDTTANSTSNLAGPGFFFSDDETLLLHNSLDTCGVTHLEITTNYSAATLTSFTSSVGGKTQSTVCGSTINQTYYHDGAATEPEVGDTCYSDLAGTTVLVKNHYRNVNLGTIHIVDNGLGQPETGIVDSIGICTI